MSMKIKNNLWPLVSTASWLFIVIIFGNWFFGGEAVTGFFTAFGVLSSFFAFFPKKVSFVENFLDKNIPIETHVGMFVLGILTLLFGFLYLFQNYQLVWERKAK